MKRLRMFGLVALALVALVLSASGSAAIVPQHSIGGVRLGLSERAVRAKLGPPHQFYKGASELGHWRRLVYPRVTIVFQNGDKATFIRTRNAREKTASGVGVGSTLAQVRARLHGEKCKREFGIHHCWLGRWDPGFVITEFVLKRSRVIQVSIGYVID